MSVHTLLLRLAGPMQAWGTQSRFSVRDTGLEPSKSGIVGLVCAALGRPRTEPIDDLEKLRMGVRVDREGVMAKDFHTALDVIKADGTKPPKAREKHPKFTVVSTRYYLADADFLVGLEGEDLVQLQEIETALHYPCWSLFLGRKSFPPTQHVHIPGGLRENVQLEDALCAHPWCPGVLPKYCWPDQLRLVFETPYGEGEAVRVDQPLSFEKGKRQFAPRYVRTDFVKLDELTIREEALCTSPA